VLSSEEGETDRRNETIAGEAEGKDRCAISPCPIREGREAGGLGCCGGGGGVALFQDSGEGLEDSDLS